MADLDQALATQLANIEKRTGKSLAQLSAIIEKSGLAKHGERVAMLKADLGMGHGDANTLVHWVAKGGASGAAPAPSADEALAGLYSGPKAALRPIHEKLLAAMRELGAFEEAPKKTYVSYRRKKQFATIGPATKTQIEIGLNAKGLKAARRLEELPAGKMCNYRVRIGDPKDVDAELVAWIRKAYDSAG